MKIQELAIIFIIIILPISLLLSEYTQFQIKTISLQTEYDAKLTAATYDAIRAFQMNTTNSTTSDLANSKMRDLEASVNAFRNSIMSGFKMNGYTEDDLNNYIPALVYTLYDGFYIYSPYKNIVDEEGVIIDNESEIQNLYGLKPYINYSCRYEKGNIDVVITYALDNYITVQGKIGTEYVNKGGYLIDEIDVNRTVTYNGEVRITSEQLKEYLPIPKPDGTIPNAYSYIKLNGTKYYRVDLKADVPGDDSIIFILNGTYLIQCQKTNTPEGEEPDQGTKDYESYSAFIDNNNLAVQYYKEAAEFTKWIREESGLGNLKYSDAVKEDGTTKIWEGNDTTIFKDESNSIENELSHFNQHRLAVIRHTIEKNLAIAISNYNNYSGAENNVFQMPELKEDEWEHITHNISLISFLQGLPIGGKIYNGYSLVTNSESKEVVLEENIYILGDDQNYHKIGDNYFENGGTVASGNYGSKSSAGRLNINFERTALTNNIETQYYYPLKEYNASYNSIVMQNDVTTYDDIYKYIKLQSNADLKQAFFTALGRERASKYNSNLSLNIDILQGDRYNVEYFANADGVTNKPSSQVKIEGIDLQLDASKPERYGYDFKGWSTSPDDTTVEYNAADWYIVDADLRLYAVWELKTYKVTYDPNGGSGGPWIDDVKHGQTITIKSWNTAKEGYTFSGWSNGTDIYQPGDTYPKTGGATSNATLYAVWELNKYTVTYDANGGSGGPGSDIATHGRTITIKSGIPTKEGYTFSGWSLSGNNSTDIYNAGDTYPKTGGITGNVRLYAVWGLSTYRVTYNANGGSGAPGPQTKVHGVNITLRAEKPSRDTYTFMGWSTSSTATTATYSAGGTFDLNGNTTLYAVWKETIKVAAIGSYVQYSANGYSNWRIMYNNNGQLDLVSEGSVANYTLKGNGGYLNAVQYLNNFANNYVTGLATSARSIGCTSSTAATISSGSWTMSGRPYSDTYYTKDVNQLKNYGLVQTDTEVWLASRKTASVTFGKKGQVRTLLTTGELDYWTLQEYYLIGMKNDRAITKGFRPVVSFPSGLKIVGGDGTKANPYKLSR